MSSLTKKSFQNHCMKFQTIISMGIQFLKKVWPLLHQGWIRPLRRACSLYRSFLRRNHNEHSQVQLGSKSRCTGKLHWALWKEEKRQLFTPNQNNPIIQQISLLWRSVTVEKGPKLLMFYMDQIQMCFFFAFSPIVTALKEE